MAILKSPLLIIGLKLDNKSNFKLESYLLYANITWLEKCFQFKYRIQTVTWQFMKRFTAVNAINLVQLHLHYTFAFFTIHYTHTHTLILIIFLVRGLFELPKS